MLSACGQVLYEADLLHFRYGSLVALSTLSPIRYLLRPKTRFPVRRLHLFPGREFHPLEAPGLSWRTIVQKEIGKHWADHAPLRGAASTRFVPTILHFHRRLQPSFNVQKNPWHAAVLSDRPHEQLVVNVVEQSFDVELDNPVIFPASPPHQRHRIQSRTPRPVAK
jgi:hypothetical protein